MVALVLAALAQVLPMAGWGTLALAVAMSDGSDVVEYGFFFALALGGFGVLAMLASLVAASLEVRRAMREGQSVLFGSVAVVLALFAPITWVIEWAIAIATFLENFRPTLL
jgi:hypothetical protein